MTAVGLVALILPLSVEGAGAASVNWSTPIQIGTPLFGPLTFTDVSCVDPTDCTAVGYAAPSGGDQPIYDIETSGTWGPVVELTDSGENASLNGVSCSAAGDCTAVGTASTIGVSFVSLPIAVTETNGVWGSFTELLEDSTTDNFFSSVSCVDAKDCTAVGENLVSPGGSFGIDATETNGVWGPLGSTAEPGFLTSVSCTSPENCTAVDRDQGDFYNPAWIVETNGVWGPLTPFPGTSSTVFGAVTPYGISCTDATHCTAVGQDNNGGEYVPEYAIETNDGWGSFTDILNPPGGSGYFNGVSCTTTSNCTAVGTDGNSQPMFDTETNGVWGPPTDVLGAAGGSGYFKAISCSGASACTAVGEDGNGDPIYAVSSPTPAPTVVNIAPGSGPTTGGTVVSLTGTNFTGATAVNFGAAGAAESFQVISPTEMDATSPPGANTVPITVTTPGGTSVPSPGGNFTYVTPTPTPTPAPPPVVTSPTTTTGHGYWLVGSDGGIFSFGAAQFYGSTGNLALNKPVVGITPAPNDEGYWLVASDGGIFTFGNLNFYGSIPGLGILPAGTKCFGADCAAQKVLDAPIVGMVPSSDGKGYFMVGADGGVFAFGDAKFEGSCPGIGGCSGAAVAVMPDASGNGYWLVTVTGHVYAFGDAVDYGAPGPQAVPVTAAVRTTDGGGYWILFSNGVVTSYGDAANLGGPAGSVGGFNPATTIFTTSDGGGYWVSSANGSVFTQGDAPFDGSMSGVHLNGSIIAATGW